MEVEGVHLISEQVEPQSCQRTCQQCNQDGRHPAAGVGVAYGAAVDHLEETGMLELMFLVLVQSEPGDLDHTGAVILTPVNLG